MTDLQIVYTSKTLLVDISLLARLLVARTRMERLCLSGVITWQGLDNPAARRELERALGNNAPHLSKLVRLFGCRDSSNTASASFTTTAAVQHDTKSLALYEIRLNGSDRDDDLQHIMTSSAAIKGFKL